MCCEVEFVAPQIVLHWSLVVPAVRILIRCVLVWVMARNWSKAGFNCSTKNAKTLSLNPKVSFSVSDLRSASLKVTDLTDGLRILILQDGRFWPARLNSTQLPDVYGVVVEKQRGNRPLILPRDDLLKEAVSIFKPGWETQPDYHWTF